MSALESSQHVVQASAIFPQVEPVPRALGFHTAFGTEWFEFSPEKIKEYFYDLARSINNRSYLNDIPFSAVLDMSSLNINELDEHPSFGSNLSTVLDRNAEHEARLNMLKQICLTVLRDAEHEALHRQVTNLMEADLNAANITWRPEENLYLKSLAMAKYRARLGIPREARNEADEFRIHLYRLLRRQASNIEIVQLYFSYAINLQHFLSILKDETVLQHDKGGFILEDGPWKYSVILNGRVGGLWYDVNDEGSFKDMLARLKKSQGEAVIIHSIEEAIQRDSEKEEKVEDDGRNSNEAVLDANGEQFFSSSSYLVHLATQPH